MTADDDDKPSPFHAGEIRLQRAIGVAERMDVFGRKVIRDHMPGQHRDFYARLPFVVTGAVDGEGAVWATLICGKPGFIESPDPRTLTFTAALDANDPACAGFSKGDAVGLLGIELHTRRRNRMNGVVVDRNASGFSVRVEHAFGNCPQYIQQRDYEWARDPSETVDLPAIDADMADARVYGVIAAADTFFVASYVNNDTGRHVDASHRGGKPGFVRINPDGSLTIPDFAGNLHFNTLGNFLLNPKSGLIFPDFETGAVVQMTGAADIVLDSDEIGAFQGAERLWIFHPRHVVLRPEALPLRWSMRRHGWSPNSLMTGDWTQTRQRLDAASKAKSWRPFRIARIVNESNVIKSFYLEPVDGAGIVRHEAGQHLPLRVPASDDGALATRVYTLSVAPSDNVYRISVRRQGSASAYLHDIMKAGDIVEARPPAGAFTIDARTTRPAVLLAAGVGVTPMLAMLRHVVYEGLRTRNIRPIWMFYAARTMAERAFDDELRALVEQANGAVRVIHILSTAEGGAEAGRDYDFIGRLDSGLLRATLPFDGYDFYMCGPRPFMQSLYDALRDLGVSDGRIHAETFGPAPLTRRSEIPVDALPRVSQKPVPVAFARSSKEARWEPGGGSLLELAESRGLTPDFGCRSGSCGTCATKLLSGEVTYAENPQTVIAEDEALICCAVPAASEDSDGDRIILDL